MKKSLMLVGMLTMALSYAQEGRVGINTENPNATLEVAGTGNKKVVDGIIAPRLHGWELRQKGTDVYGEAQKGAIVYMITAVENPAYRQGQLVNITTPGYYYFDGTVWVKFNPTYTAGNGIAINDGVISATGENANIYTNDGTLTGNRTVTMGNRTLKFTGNNTSFVRNGETISVKSEGNNQSSYIGFYKNGDNNERNAYLGFGTATNNDFYIANTLGDGVRISTKNTDGVTELASKLKVNNIPEEHNVNNSILVADKQGNVKRTNLYKAGEGISIDPATNTISLAEGNGVSSNLYTADGTLTGNRTVTMDNKSLNFAGGKVGVNTANPTTSLDITSSTIGGGFRLADGSQEKGKVLTAGVDGRASWEWPTSPMQVFDLRSVKNLTIPAGSKDLHYTGIQLLLQPGKWVTTISLGVTHNASPSFRIGGTFLRLRLLSHAQATNDIIAGAGSGGMLHPNAISSKFASLLIPFNARQSTLTGTLDVENNTNAPIRVYVYADIAATEGGNVDGNQTTLMFDWNESSLSTTEVR